LLFLAKNKATNLDNLFLLDKDKNFNPKLIIFLLNFYCLFF